MNEAAVVLFSGGIDSTTALHWSIRRFAAVSALIFDYGQRHRLEVTMARRIASDLKVAFRVWKIPLRHLLHSALLDEDLAIADSLAKVRREKIPASYVPFRNGIFLSLAAAFAESRNIFDLVAGFNGIDSPDYPDTSELFRRSMERTLNQGTAARRIGRRFRIHAPLIRMSKAEIIRFGMKLGADYSRSLSCYRGAEIPCGACPACDIRRRAFTQLGLEDPLRRRLAKEGKT